MLYGRAVVLLRYNTREAHIKAHGKALDAALQNGLEESGRFPDWDMISVRATHTTFEVIVEVHEDYQS